MQQSKLAVSKTMRAILTIVIAFFVRLICGAQVLPSIIDTSFWVPNSNVRSVIRHGNTVYIGGNFTHVGPYTGGAVAVDTNSGNLVGAPLKVDGGLGAAIPDGMGGWYIGGYFTSVLGVPRKCLAHILPDNTLDSNFAIGISNHHTSGLGIHSMVLKDSMLYVGGTFYEIGGVLRNNIAQINTRTGQVTAWNAHFTIRSTVSDLVLKDSSLFLVGNIETITGQVRIGVASLNANTGHINNWNLRASEIRYACLKLYGNELIIGGTIRFTDNNGAVNTYSVLISDVNTATIRNKIFITNDYLNAMAVVDDRLFIGGYYSPQNAGTSLKGLGVINLRTGNVINWNVLGIGPNDTMFIDEMAVYGNKLYFGGLFSRVGASQRLNAAAIDHTTYQLSNWNPEPSDRVFTMIGDGNRLLMGGSFVSLKGERRNRLAAFDATTGQLTSWNPSANDYVQTLSFQNGLIYAGGAFTRIGNLPTYTIAAIDSASGVPTSWRPSIGYPPQSQPLITNIVQHGATTYITGNLSSVSGELRKNIAAIETSSGQVKSWNAFLNGFAVHDMMVSSNRLYVCGSFTNIGNQSRNMLAALDPVTGLANHWNPNPDYPVVSVKERNGIIYALSNFTRNGATFRATCGVAVIDSSTGSVIDMYPLEGRITNSLLDDNILYVSGYFYKNQSNESLGIVAIDLNTGELVDWNPEVAPFSLSMAVNENMLYLGGNFRKIGGTGHTYFAALYKPYITKVANSLRRHKLVTIFPNPAATSIRVTSKATIHTITLLDQLGRVVLVKENPLNNSVDISHVPGGSYLVKVVTTDGTSTQRLVVIR